jgi:hypothetical protein
MKCNMCGWELTHCPCGGEYEEPALAAAEETARREIEIAERMREERDEALGRLLVAEAGAEQADYWAKRTQETENELAAALERVAALEEAIRRHLAKQAMCACDDCHALRALLSADADR